MHREEYTNHKCQFHDLPQSKHPYEWHPDQEMRSLFSISEVPLVALIQPYSHPLPKK